MHDADFYAAMFRSSFLDTVARNGLRLAHNWAQPCHAVNVQAELDAVAPEVLGGVQDQIASVDAALLRCPPSSLHVSIDSPVAVENDYPTSTAALPTTIGPAGSKGSPASCNG